MDGNAFTADWMTQTPFMVGLFTFAPEGSGTRYRAGECTRRTAGMQPQQEDEPSDTGIDNLCYISTMDAAVCWFPSSGLGTGLQSCFPKSVQDRKLQLRQPRSQSGDWERAT